MRTLRNSLVLTSLLVVVSLGLMGCPPGLALQGTWRLVDAGGLGAEDTLLWIFQGDRFTQQADDETASFAFSVDESVTPAVLTFTDDEGESQSAIWEVDGNMLRVGFTLDGTAPESFDAAIVFTFERQ